MSKTEAGRGPGSKSTVTAGRNIIAARPASRGGGQSGSNGAASRPIGGAFRPPSNGSGLPSAGRRLAGQSDSATKAGADKWVCPACDEPNRLSRTECNNCGRPRPPAAGPKSINAVDEELQTAVMKIFNWCDADGDGLLSKLEFAAAQRMIAEVCPEEFNDSAARNTFASAQDCTTAAYIDENTFMAASQAILDTLSLPRHALLQALLRQTSGRSSNFDRSVSDLKHKLVRNVSGLPEDTGVEPPAALPLWRTATGRNEFPLPPGVAGGTPAALVAFKVLQYLAMRTEDASMIDNELASRMMGHRSMFKNMFDMCGEIRGVHAVNHAANTNGRALDVEVFLMKATDADQLFRVRVTNMMVTDGVLRGLKGFEPGAIAPSEVPHALYAEIQGNIGAKSEADLSALGKPMRPPTLQRSVSTLADSDLQDAHLVLTATPVARHLFRLKFKLMDRKGPAAHYILVIPRLQTASTGHARYSDHEVRLQVNGGTQPKRMDFSSFIAANVRGTMVGSLEIEHEFMSNRVRIQESAAACHADIVPAPTLTCEERANNVADTPEQATKLRKLLEAQGLARRSGERDIAYAVRLGRALGSGQYKYDVEATEAHLETLPPLIWEKRCGDCSAFNAGFVYALRAFGIPARVSLGFKYGKAIQQACGSIVAPHAQSVFFAEGIGWVPCDATMGIKRLGHEATGLISFIEWRPATLNLREAEELAKVFLPGRAPGLESTFEIVPTTASLEALGKDEEYSVEMWQAKVAKLTTSGKKSWADDLESFAKVLAWTEDGRAMKFSAEQLARGLAAFELGKFSELGKGSALTASSNAGAKYYEGGPYRSDALDPMRLKENMIVQEGIEGVMGSIGGNGGQVDWSSMWPYGVFSCSYEFEEKLAEAEQVPWRTSGW